MRSPYDAYMQSQQRQGQETTNSPFGQFVSSEAPYQGVPQAAMASASMKRGANLDKTRQQSYVNYIGDVVNARMSPTEADERAAFIPNTFSSRSYSGSNYIDPNAQMAAGAIPAAYQYAGLYNSDFDYGVNRLEWGGPSSTRTTADDFLDRTRINSGRNQAEDALRRALIPEYLRRDTADKLGNRWEEGWDSEFNELKADRADQQSSWWAGANWANNSIRPGGIEVVQPERQQLLSPESSVYHAARREMTSPESQRLVSPARQIETSPARQELVREAYTTPEAWTRNNAAWQAYTQMLDNTVIYPGQDRHFYYDTFDANQPNSVRETPVFNEDVFRWTVEADGEEALYDRALSQLTAYYNTVDPRAGFEGRAGNFDVTYRSGVDYPTDWGARAGIDLWTHAGNPVSSYQTYLNDPDGPMFNPYRIDYQFSLPRNVFNYVEPQPVPAEYRTIPATYENAPAIYETVPAQYRDIPAYTETIPAVYQTIPAVTRATPSSLRAGFNTIVDPITGVQIPNWWGPNSSDLVPYYGQPDWFMR